MKVDIYDISGKKSGDMDLPDNVFGVEVKEALLWEQVKAQRASARAGTHSTKTRGEVRGGGAKPFKQKGTGRARQGSSRAPNLVGGGTIFGPKPRDYTMRLPRSARRSALRSALSVRAKSQNLLILEPANLEAPKTKTVEAFLDKLGSKNVLIVDRGNFNLQRSTRNLDKSNYIEVDGLNVYDILNHEKVILSRSVLEEVIRRAQPQSKAAEAA